MEWRRAGDAVWFEVHVNPLQGKEKSFLGGSAVFHDVSWARSLLGELEYANDRLKTAYEELPTINDALRDRGLELDELNDFPESVLIAVQAGIVVIDAEMRSKAWNRGAENLWGVRREAATGTHLLNLDIGLPIAELRPVVRDALADAGSRAEQTLDAVNRRGRAVEVRLLCSARQGRDGQSVGAWLMMEEIGPAAEETVSGPGGC